MYLDTIVTSFIFAMTVLVCCSSEMIKNRTEKATMTFNADCVEFGGIENGVTTKIDTGNIQALHIECNTGFDLIGRPKVLCKDGVWENIPRPQCSKRCPPPPFMLNAEIVIEGHKDEEGRYRKSSLATYKCGPGFHLNPESSQYRGCKDGIWTGNHGSCVSDGCDRPADIAYGYYVLKSIKDQNNSPPEGRVSVGQRAHYSCNLGYALAGPEILQCIDTGGWSPRLPPQCSKTATEVVVDGADEGSCATLPAAPHTTVSTIQGQQTANNAPAGTALEIRCKPGYRDTRYPCEAATLSCVGGVWQGRLPSCVEVDGCQSPPNIDHGALFGLATDGHYQINAEVAYTCQKGYFLDGDPILTCQPDGCWEPEVLPKCMSDNPSNPFFAADYITTSNTLIVSLATALAAMLILFGMGVCLVVVCRRHRRLGLHRQSAHHRTRRASNPALTQPPGGGGGVANGSALLHDPDRVALIAFADGVQLGESLLPSYEEAIREQRGNVIGSAGLLGCRTLRPHWGPPRRARGPGSSNGEAHVTRQSSSTSHSASLRSGGDSMGSTDTMAPSEVSTNVTLDTVSSHTCSSGSQSASCRAMYGSLASFDTSSILNTEGVPLLEESEMEEGVMGSTPTLAVEQQIQENGSFKYRRASPDLA